MTLQTSSTFRLAFDHHLQHQLTPLRRILRLLHPQGDVESTLAFWGDMGFNTSAPTERIRLETLECKEERTLPDGTLRTHPVLVNAHTQRLFDLEEGFTPDQLIRNLHAIQQEAQLELTPINSISFDPTPRFSIEMETGTGKTYLFLRAIHELHKRYGYQKFIILTHLTAISEGIKQSYASLEADFDAMYNQRQVLIEYDSSKTTQARDFAMNDALQVLLLGRDSINKETNLFNQVADGQATTSMNYVSATRPIVIIDEPQNFTGEATKEALKKLNPLFVLDFSATHKESFPLLHSLSFYEAYEQGLVKHIALDSDASEQSCTGFYVKVKDIKTSTKNNPKAELEINHRTYHGYYERRSVWVEAGESLYDFTATEKAPHYKLTSYQWQVDSISKKEGVVLFNEENPEERLSIRKGASHNPETNAHKNAMIEATIRHHLEKQLTLHRSKQKVKVLSLFFIDEVKKYRSSNDSETIGDYAKTFEFIYERLSQDPKYHLLALPKAKNVHKGYFAQDKTGNFKNSAMNDDGVLKRETSDVKEAFEMIMKNKALLLDLSNDVQFIFSHSAISEGWDNPNVFQICFLKEQGSIRRAKQELGRGLRLAVDSSGKRITDNQKLNTLTVITDASREEFIQQFKANLQEECQNRKLLTVAWFEERINAVAKTFHVEEATFAPIREALILTLQSENIVDADGVVHRSHYSPVVAEKLKQVIVHSAMPEVSKESLLENTNALLDPTPDISKTSSTNPPAQTTQAVINKKLLLDPLFKKLWKRIRRKVYYQLFFDSHQLKNKVIKEVLDKLQDSKYENVDKVTRRTERIQSLDLDRLDSDSNLKRESSKTYQRQEGVAYQRESIIYQLADKTKLTDKTISEILQSIAEKREDFWLLLYHDTSLVSSLSTWIIDAFKMMMLGDSDIEYNKMQGSFYHQSVFEKDLEERNDKKISKHLLVELKEGAEKTISNPVLLSENVDTEKRFALKASESNDTLLFIKLPKRFNIPTPVGTYSPDWAVVERPIRAGGDESIRYLIKETKSSTEKSDKRPTEQAKIDSARKLTNANVCGLEYDVVDNS
jgi:type III restriction enzyme